MENCHSTKRNAKLNVHQLLHPHLHKSRLRKTMSKWQRSVVKLMSQKPTALSRFKKGTPSM